MTRDDSGTPALGPAATGRGFTGNWASVPGGPGADELAQLDPSSPSEWTGAYQVTRTDLDPVQLQEDFVRQLGHDVTITLRQPTDTKPGLLRVQSVENGVDLDLDPAVVGAVVAENAPPETNAQRFLREFDAAADVNTKLTTIRDYVARDVVEEEHQSEALRRTKKRLTRLFAPHVTTKNSSLPINPDTGQPISVQAL